MSGRNGGQFSHVPSSLRQWARTAERGNAAARATAEAKRVEAERNAPPMRQSWPNTEFFAPSGSGARSNLKKQAGRPREEN